MIIRLLKINAYEKLRNLKWNIIEFISDYKHWNWLELDGPLVNHVRLEFWRAWKKTIVCVRHVFVQTFRKIVKVAHKKNMSYKSLKKLYLLFIFLTTRLTKNLLFILNLTPNLYPVSKLHPNLHFFIMRLQRHRLMTFFLQ